MISIEEASGFGGVLRDKYPGFFIDVAEAAGLITVHENERPFLRENFDRNQENWYVLEAILEDVELLITIDPDMRR